MEDKQGITKDYSRIKEDIEKIENFQKVADIFKQLSDTSRLKIFFMLCHTEECVITIAETVGMTNPAVAHHLKQLKAASLVTSSRRGKEVYYKAADSVVAQHLHETIEQVMSIVCPDWAGD